MSIQHGTTQFTARSWHAHGYLGIVSCSSLSNTAIIQNLTCPTWYLLTYKMSCLGACCSFTSLIPFVFSLAAYFSRTIMIFASLALLSGMVLLSSAAPWYSPPAPVTHYVNVSNDTAGLLYDPPYIVSKLKRHHASTLVLTRPSSRTPGLETPSRSSSIPRTTL